MPRYQTVSYCYAIIIKLVQHPIHGFSWWPQIDTFLVPYAVSVTPIDDCTGPCLITATWRCCKNCSQLESSFLWKLWSHWLKGFRQRQIALVRQGPGLVSVGLSVTVRYETRPRLAWCDHSCDWLIYMLGKLQCIVLSHYRHFYHYRNFCHCLEANGSDITTVLAGRTNSGTVQIPNSGGEKSLLWYEGQNKRGIL